MTFHIIICQTTKNPKGSRPVLFVNMKPGYPDKMVGIYIIKPLWEINRGNKCNLVKADQLIKWCEAIHQESS